MNKKMKRIVTGMLVFCLVIIGLSLQGVLNAKASTDVLVKPMEVNEYRQNGEFTAPEETGYVFSGWYQEEDCKNPLGKNVTEGSAYARFVPAEVLSVKAQISANVLDSDTSDDGKAAIRFVTTVDSLNYSEVGFDITINEKTQRKASNMVYDKLYAIGKTAGETMQYTPQQFSPLSTYFKTWAFINIPETAYETGITVQPVWVTLDGTTVYGEEVVKTIQQGIDDYFNPTPDTSWYDESKSEYTISTLQELYGFAKLVNTDKVTFAGKTVKLGADITVNRGNAEEWETDAPKDINKWTPVNGFSGKFYGQGHTISGVYATGSFVGLFHTINSGSTVEDLRIVNSYFGGTSTGTRQSVGSVAGRNHGTIKNVYSAAIVKNSSEMTGGIAGMVVNSQGSFINCWFDGKIINAKQSCGGILGGLYGYGTATKENNTATIEHCLNTGALSVHGTSETAIICVGGLCGRVQTGTLTLTDSLNAGTLDTIGAQVGAVVGTLANANSAVIATNVYGVEDTLSPRLISWNQNNGPVEETNFEIKTEEELTGYNAYQNTKLDFANCWVFRFDQVPVLKSFDKGDIDVSWYDESKSEYTIATCQELYGFAELVNTSKVDFKDKTVYLGRDITVNQGNAKDWETTVPEKQWTPVKGFTGTFDGQGHTISGIYVYVTDTYAGLFDTLTSGTTVMDLKLVNSYIEGNWSKATGSRAGTGSIAGRSQGGTITKVYSEAIVKNSYQMTGGIVGMITEGQSSITNCWFAGEISGTTNSGGVLGGTYGVNASTQNENWATIEHCLNTGTLTIPGTTKATAVGGLCGGIQNVSKLTVKDSLNAGTLAEGSNVNANQTATIVGVNHAKGALVADCVYGVEDFSGKVIGYEGGSVSEESKDYEAIALDQITGYSAYQNTKLDFANYWVLRFDQVPVLKVFDEGDINVSWYDESKSEYTIRTLQELYGFRELCSTDNNYFKGKVIMLDADITLNEGDAKDWAENAPALEWKPVNFSGTFNGQGHTLSGIYVKTEETTTYAGLFGTINGDATVMNLKLVNSYIEGTQGDKAQRTGVGSIAGRNHGKIDTVYSEAIVKNSAQMTGGIAGTVTDSQKNSITNCWFNGEINGSGSNGGILGGIYGTKEKPSTATIEHCLNTGALKITGPTDAEVTEKFKQSTAIGGLCGYIQNFSNLIVTDSLNAGSYKHVVGKIAQVGTVVGALHNNGSLTVNNAYGITEFTENLIGWKSTTKEYTQVEGTAFEALSKEACYNRGAAGLSFEGTDIKWISRENDIPMLASFLDIANGLAR